MPVHIALLRAINVGGHGTIAMADLRGVFAELGFAGVQTLLQTGNVVFSAPVRSSAALERRIEDALARRLAVRSDVLLRGLGDLTEVIDRNPFPDHAARDPARVVVMFLKEAPASGAVERLRSEITGPELVHGDGRHAYLVYPNGQGRSRVGGPFVEKRLGTRGTARNWNTVMKLAALAREASGRAS